MESHADDLEIRMTGENCAAFQQGIQDNQQDLENAMSPYRQDFFPRLAEIFGLDSQKDLTIPEAIDMCSYLDWA